MGQNKKILNNLKYVQVPERGINIKNFPDFMVVGPQRTGSTWLHSNLVLHPEVFMSNPKEIFFFNLLNKPNHKKYKSNSLAWYMKFFHDKPLSYVQKNLSSFRKYGKLYKPVVRGEATASYAAMAEDLVDEVIKLNPHIKIILTVRNPIQRAWSHAKKDLVKKRKLRSINDVSSDELKAYLVDDYQIACGNYSAAIDKWSKKLKKSHLFIGNFENVIYSPIEYLKSIYKFLGVESDERYTVNAGSKVNPTNNENLLAGYHEMLSSLFAEEFELLEKRFGFVWDENGKSLPLVHVV